MQEKEKFKQQLGQLHKLLWGFLILIALVAGVCWYWLTHPAAPEWEALPPTDTEEQVAGTDTGEEDPDRIENGIHVRTGLIAAEGYTQVVNNCTNCHSAKIVIQNRMDRERWIATIRWMQDTQNLWDLGENEKVIIDYLVTNYPPQKKGRRANLEVAEWYRLE